VSDPSLAMANRANNVPHVTGEEPAPLVMTGEHLALVHPRGTVELQRHGDVRPAHEPVHTVRAGGHHHGVLVLRNNNSRGDTGAMLTPGQEPVRAVTTAGHQSVVIPYQRRSEPGLAAEQPSPTLTTRDRLALVVPAGGGWADRAALADTEPIGTQTATESRAVVWSDDEIDACLFRMFALHEIAGAMAMRTGHNGEPYVVTGNKRERMAQYGNSVTPPAMQLIISRLLEVVDLEGAVDLFCGAGGSSTGAARAGADLRLGLNHWQRAIETHAANFPNAEHDCNDVQALTTAQVKSYLNFAKADLLIGSPECTNHSIAKGSRRKKMQSASLWEDGPAGDAEQDRSRATMWDMVRWAELAMLAGRPFKAIVVENVVDAFKWGLDDNGGLFSAWLSAMDALGYEHEIVWLNSMFAHDGGELVPQSRDRMYPVFWLKGMRRPNLRVEPISWCPWCEKPVGGRQAWKKPGARVWGRYGAQYVYCCPDCHRTVLPGAAPAINIIDETLPAQAIGERSKPLAPNTLKRIRRGLERLSNEPFAIRLTHGITPRPLTLPLVTLTRRHDPAIVFPVAGNTHERTAGNRARRAAERPLDTVHGTLDRAIVVPPMGSVIPRPAATDPSPTQTTTTRAAIVNPPQEA
jgi:DNA (cytosine-5)-methyltransferase 1